MTTITVTNDLDVTEKYADLMKKSLSGDSVYIRAKETLQSLVDEYKMDDATKAEILSGILTNAVNTITSASMSTAMAWAQAEKDIALRKLELEKQLDILDKEDLLKDAQVESTINATRLAKVESKRVYGTATFDPSGNILSLDDTGKVYKDILLTEANTSKVSVEEELTQQKVTESQAAVHKIVADTYVNHGNFTYSPISGSGISTVTQEHLPTHKTLSETQRDIAVEQAKGYTYNAWANALTGSASMLGTAMASQYEIFGTGEPGNVLLTTVLDTATQLKNAATP